MKTTQTEIKCSQNKTNSQLRNTKTYHLKSKHEVFKHCTQFKKHIRVHNS